jgi:hypothetical protein
MSIDAGRFLFNLGCNTINVQPEFGPGYVFFGNIITTSMACLPEVAMREVLLAEVLASIEAMQIGAGDAVAFYDATFYDATNGLALGAVLSNNRLLSSLDLFGRKSFKIE